MLQWLINLVESLKESTLVWLILSLSTLIGIPAFFYSIVTRNKKELSYSKREEVLVSPVSEGFNKKIKMYYDGREVKNVSVSRYAIWNSGNEKLEPQDFVSDKPLTISAKGDAVILDIAIDYKSDEDNKIEISDPTSKEAKIDFEYLSRRDGAIIQVVHTGKAEEIELSCKIKGGKKLRKYTPIREYAPKLSECSDINLSECSDIMLSEYSDISKCSDIKLSVYSVIMGIGIYVYEYMQSAKIGIPAKLRKHIPAKLRKHF